MDCSTPGFLVLHYLPEFAQLISIESVMPSNHLILCHLLLFWPSIFPSIRVFSNESVLRIRWPKYWSFSFSISPSNEYSGLISLRIDWFDLLAVQGTLKSLLQHQSLKASILWCSAIQFLFCLHWVFAAVLDSLLLVVACGLLPVVHKLCLLQQEALEAVGSGVMVHRLSCHMA